MLGAESEVHGWMYFWLNSFTLYLLACQMRVIVAIQDFVVGFVSRLSSAN